MADLFGRSDPRTSPATTNAISSPASAGGPTPPQSRRGLPVDRSGPAPVPVSRFRSLAHDVAMPTSVTSGPLFTASSPSAALQASLESRLRTEMDASGTPEYALTWKLQDMPAGPPICALLARARRIRDSGSSGSRSGWATPRASDGAKSSPNSRDGSGSLHLPGQMARAGWATPCARDGKSARRPEKSWDSRLAERRAVQLNDQMTLTGRHMTKPPTSGATGTKKSAVPHPAFPCWLMGFPAAFWRSICSATRSTPNSLPPGSG